MVRIRGLLATECSGFFVIATRIRLDPPRSKPVSRLELSASVLSKEVDHGPGSDTNRLLSSTAGFAVQGKRLPSTDIGVAFDCYRVPADSTG